MTKSLSNMIKAYSVRYKEEKKVVDVAERAAALNAAGMVSTTNTAGDGEPEAAFVSGLQAIALEEQEGEAPEEAEVSGDEIPEEELSPEEKAARAARRAQELKRIKYELTEAEKMALRIEMEKEIRTQADIILEQARSQGEQLKTKAKLAAEAEKLEIFETAKREGYEEGSLAVQQELSRLQEEFAEKERQLTAEYEQKTAELEPMAAEVVIQLLDGLTGVLLESRKGIVTYLVSKALSEADRSDSFLVKVSREDFEEVRKASDTLRSLFEREVSLEVVQDSLLKKGECMIETDSNIIDCSLGTQLEGLKEDIRLLSIQERA
ncbi:MAG: FliH/SctL family protein [Lachnospiraceae bacterium]